MIRWIKCDPFNYPGSLVDDDKWRTIRPHNQRKNYPLWRLDLQWPYSNPHHWISSYQNIFATVNYNSVIVRYFTNQKMYSPRQHKLNKPFFTEKLKQPQGAIFSRSQDTKPNLGSLVGNFAMNIPYRSLTQIRQV